LEGADALLANTAADAIIADRAYDASKRVLDPLQHAGKQVVIPAGCPLTTKLLEDRGYRAHPVQLDEFMKSGGAAKCLTLALD